MLRGSSKRVGLLALTVLVLAMALAACGGGDDSTSDTSEPSTGAETTTETTSETSEGSGGGTAAAAAVVKPFLGKPSPFPVIDDLKELPPKGTTIAFVDVGTPYSTLFWEILQPAAETMGVKLERVKAGASAQGVASAFDSILAKKPAAVIVTAINIDLWKNQLKELQDAEIPIVTTGVAGTEPYGIEGAQASEALAEVAGGLIANYVVGEMNPEANAVVYEVPELAYSKFLAEQFSHELESVCPDCTVRTGQISITEIGNSAPATVVSDMQANPDTDVAFFTSPETMLGLPTALKAAGMDVETITYAATPQNLEYVKNGEQTASWEVDLPVLTWSLLDEAARKMAGQKLTGPEGEGLTDYAFLTKKDITFDPAGGWTGYPDFPERYAKLWGVEG